MAFSPFTMLCNHNLSLVPIHFHHPKIKLSPCKVVLPHSPLPPTPGNHKSALSA